MCCQIPPYGDLRPTQTNSVDDHRLAMWAWASFATGVVLLSLSLASAIWLASRLT
jgi:5-enolpyruvylshikimate-3-phosphate synthase